MVVSADLRTETRWPAYVQTVLEATPIRCTIAFPLGAGGVDLGVLALYSDVAGWVTDSVADRGSLFAIQASVAILSARASQQADKLVAALTSNRRIGIAVGIVMTSLLVNDQTAFDLLRTTSQRTNCKLHEIAETSSSRAPSRTQHVAPHDNTAAYDNPL